MQPELNEQTSNQFIAQKDPRDLKILTFCLDKKPSPEVSLKLENLADTLGEYIRKAFTNSSEPIFKIKHGELIPDERYRKEFYSRISELNPIERNLDLTKHPVFYLVFSSKSELLFPTYEFRNLCDIFGLLYKCKLSITQKTPEAKITSYDTYELENLGNCPALIEVTLSAETLKNLQTIESDCYHTTTTPRPIDLTTAIDEISSKISSSPLSGKRTFSFKFSVPYSDSCPASELNCRTDIAEKLWPGSITKFKDFFATCLKISPGKTEEEKMLVRNVPYSNRDLCLKGCIKFEFNASPNIFNNEDFISLIKKLQNKYHHQIGISLASGYPTWFNTTGNLYTLSPEEFGLSVEAETYSAGKKILESIGKKLEKLISPPSSYSKTSRFFPKVDESQNPATVRDSSSTEPVIFDKHST